MSNRLQYHAIELFFIVFSADTSDYYNKPFFFHFFFQPPLLSSVYVKRWIRIVLNVSVSTNSLFVKPILFNKFKPSERLCCCIILFLLEYSKNTERPFCVVIYGLYDLTATKTGISVIG